LYLLGQPQCIFTNAFPFFLLPGDGGTTGVTFTGGGGGGCDFSGGGGAGGSGIVIIRYVTPV
jgi:hypothetical protein